MDQKEAREIIPANISANISKYPATLESFKEKKQGDRNRQVLLNKVRNFWIEGVLETSLAGRVFIELGLQSRLDAIAHPWQMDWATPEDARQPLPPGIKAINQFDRLGIGRTLLILGDPGSGKTTTLLEIARELVIRAEQDPDQAIPIVFNLSSWQDKQPISDWLVRELNTKYQVPKKISKVWIDDQKILPLLDGLDEVSIDRRNACVQAINYFHTKFEMTEIVVCSRSLDYEALTQHLQFQGAIFLQPLKEEQVYEYFESLGSELEGLREILPTDPKLMELAKSPLMLSIMAIAYRGISVTELIAMSFGENHVQILFDTYIDRMLQRRSSKKYPPEKVKLWLSFLAKQLVRESQTVFLIERMQPSWLVTDSQTIYSISIGLILTPIFVPIVLLTVEVMLTQFNVLATVLDIYSNIFTTYDDFPIKASELCLISLSIALSWGLMKMGGRLVGQIPINIPRPIWAMTFAITSGLFVSIFVQSSFLLNRSSYSLCAMVTSLIAWKIFNQPIIPCETLTWSWKDAKNKAKIGQVIGLVCGLIAGLIISYVEFEDLMNAWSIFNFDQLG